MKPSRSIWILLPLAFPCGGLIASREITAFPGAEGFAAHSTGGRGGDAYQVTSLAPGGPGSLHEAITTVPPEGRTIVFNATEAEHSSWPQTCGLLISQ
jgi:hypothetical protein